MDFNSRDWALCSGGLFGSICASNSPVATSNRNGLADISIRGTRQNHDKGFQEPTKIRSRILATHNAFVGGLGVKAEFPTPLK